MILEHSSTEDASEEDKSYFLRNIAHIDSVVNHGLALIKKNKGKELLTMLEAELFNFYAHPHNTAGNEIAVELYETPVNFASYKIYIDAEESTAINYFDKIEITHNNNGENILVQLENKSKETIEVLSVSVVYYNNGKTVGIKEGFEVDVKPGRKGNFTLDFPQDLEYEDVEFDDYKVYVKEVYSYNF